MSMSYIREAYNVPAKRGLRVTVYGNPAIIVGSDGCYLRVRLDGERITHLVHPTDNVKYLKTDTAEPTAEVN